MKFKILLLTVLLFTLSVSLFANPIIDSIGVKNNDGKKMILFKVKAGDTYYSIGHRYNIKPQVLMKFNGSKKETLSLGKIVNVPTDIPYKKSKKASEEASVKETKKEKKARLASEAKAEEASHKKHKESDNVASNPAPEQPAQENTAAQQTAQVVQQPVQEDNTPPTQYKVSAGETLYAIAKRFNTNVDAITKLNSLTSTSLQPGQIILVKPSTGQQQPQQAAQQTVQQATSADTQHVVATRDSNLAPSIAKDSANHLNANKYGLYEKNEKGVASWIDDPSLDPNKKLVLHRTAPIGTVIKITNPMTNRTTFAKVVGRFTDNESTKDVILVMTKNVADSLGALDKRFHVNISYGSPNE
jgi:LysM repeat protein